MESEIDSAIQKIKNLRKYQNSLNEKLLKPSENILLKKKKCINIEKTINMVIFFLLNLIFFLDGIIESSKNDCSNFRIPYS